MIVRFSIYSALCGVACGQQDQAVDRQGEDTAIICETGGLGGGEGGNVHANPPLPNLPNPNLKQHRRQVMIEFVSKVDVNRDLQLDHSELQALDFLTRQQLLKKLDENLDRKLSAQEIAQADEKAWTTQPEYPYAERPDGEATTQPQAYRNMRRFGIGLQQASPPPRNPPFAQAATFGTSSNFRPPRRSNSFGPPRGGGRCQSSRAGSFDVFVRGPGGR